MFILSVAFSLNTCMLIKYSSIANKIKNRITKSHVRWLNHHKNYPFLNNFVFRTVVNICASHIIKICNKQKNQEIGIKNCKVKRGKSCVYYTTSGSTTKAKLLECYFLTCGRVETKFEHLKDGEAAVGGERGGDGGEGE